MSYILILSVLLLTVYGQIVIKWRSIVAGAVERTPEHSPYLLVMILDPWVWSGLAAAVVASLCWILAIERTPLTLAYPFMALSFVLVPVASRLFLGESVSGIQWLGGALIVIGVALAAHPR